jgi:micrococcal nuclease
LLAVGLVLAGCDTSEPRGEGAGKERGPEKAAKDDRPDSDAGIKNEVKRSDSGSISSPAGARYSASPKPDEVLTSQYEYVNAGRYRAAYDLFDDQSQRAISLKEYRAFFASVAPYEITSYSFPSVRARGDTASVVADLVVSSAEGYDEYRVTQRLVREGGSWRVVMREEQVTSFAGERGDSASASAPESSASGGSGGDHDATVTVSRVVDGDTIEISPAVDGNEEVRLIGVDTPETKDPSEGVEPYGPEASAFATDELAGQRVDLEFDVERVDQYDRLLAYVYVGGEMFNEALLEGGYAQTYPYEPNTRYEVRFAAAQKEARAAGLGMWGLPHAQQCELADRGNGIGEGSPGCARSSVTPSASASPSASPSASASASVGARGGPPAPSGGDIDCDQVDGPIRTPPGDPDNLDGDGDGWACE